MSTKHVALTAALGLAFAAPIAANADDLTAMRPLPPAQFQNTRTTADPMAGQFSVNFDGAGRYLGTGRPEPPSREDLTVATERARHQSAAVDGSARRAAVDGVVANLRTRLRLLETPSVARR